MLGYTETEESGVRARTSSTGQTDTLSKYHIVRRLGSGGMAEIYLARSLGIEGFEKYVVLKKILPEHSSNPAFVRMFLDEARLAAKLQHQNIAQVYDIGRIADGYFFVMEYLHGRDLRSLKREHRKRGARLPIHHALTVAAGAAAGLDYAHNASDRRGKPLGLVHRDVSPSNIVVTFDGAVKLVDFGIARASNTPSETRSGALKGKVPYMSPEQCRGADLDGRSDIFSLGVTLYELSTGISPFCRKGDTDYVVLERICAGAYTSPTEVVAGYPPALEQIVSRALAVDRDKRYQSARDMLRELEGAAADLGVPLSATALADHLRTIYGEQPLPWAAAFDAPALIPADTPETFEDDELLCKTIATGSVVEGVTLFEITPTSAVGVSVTSRATSLQPKRPLLWLGLAAVVAAGGIALALSALKSDGATSDDQVAPLTKPTQSDTAKTEATPTPTPTPASAAPAPSAIGAERLPPIETSPPKAFVPVDDTGEVSTSENSKSIAKRERRRRKRARRNKNSRESSSTTSAKSTESTAKVDTKPLAKPPKQDKPNKKPGDPSKKEPGLLDRKW